MLVERSNERRRQGHPIEERLPHHSPGKMEPVLMLRIEESRELVDLISEIPRFPNLEEALVGIENLLRHDLKPLPRHTSSIVGKLGLVCDFESTNSMEFLLIQ